MREYLNELELEEVISKKMISSYFLMFLGTLITFSIMFSSLLFEPVYNMVVTFSTYSFIVMLGSVFGLSYLLYRANNFILRIGFLLYSVIMGFALAPVLYIYETASILLLLGSTVFTFLAMTLYGYFTSYSLRPYSKYLVGILMGMIGIGILNIFLNIPLLDNILSIIGLIVFIIYTAVDTQKLKEDIMILYYNGDYQILERVQIIGALNLYLDFINMFLYMLRLFGKKRN